MNWIQCTKVTNDPQKLSIPGQTVLIWLDGRIEKARLFQGQFWYAGRHVMPTHYAELPLGPNGEKSK